MSSSESSSDSGRLLCAVTRVSAASLAHIALDDTRCTVCAVSRLDPQGPRRAQAQGEAVAGRWAQLCTAQGAGEKVACVAPPPRSPSLLQDWRQ
jgi:hypothetical protein